MNLTFGLSRAVPDGVTTAWGARLIAPNDLVWDRQDLDAIDDDAKTALVWWLNGDPHGTGAIKRMLEALASTRLAESDEVSTIFEDEHGIIVGSTNGASGYVYVAGWLKTESEDG